MVAGGLANVAGGGAQALTIATEEQAGDMVSGEAFDGTEFINDAHDAGLNAPQIAYNFGAGGLLAGAIYLPVRSLTGPTYRIPDSMFFDDTYFASKGYLVGTGAAAINVVTTTTQQAVLDSATHLIRRYASSE